MGRLLLMVSLFSLFGCAGSVDRNLPGLDAGSESGVAFPDGLRAEGAKPWDGPLPSETGVYPDLAAAPDTLPPDTAPPCSSHEEKLDGKDNNCNGEVDEGFWAAVPGVAYGALTLEHSGCTQQTAFSDDCMAASNRRCQGLGYVGGFGPVEYGPSAANIVCLADALYTSETFAALNARHPGCKETEAFSLSCNSAIHRACAAKGHVSGVGPVEHAAGKATIICVEHAKVYQVSFGTLASHHGGCTAQKSFAPDCQAAINRFCASKGHVTGFGPVEQGTDAHVTCLDKG